MVARTQYTGAAGVASKNCVGGGGRGKFNFSKLNPFAKKTAPERQVAEAPRSCVPWQASAECNAGIQGWLVPQCRRHNERYDRGNLGKLFAVFTVKTQHGLLKMYVARTCVVGPSFNYLRSTETWVEPSAGISTRMLKICWRPSSLAVCDSRRLPRTWYFPAGMMNVTRPLG